MAELDLCVLTEIIEFFSACEIVFSLSRHLTKPDNSINGATIKHY